MRISDWSSDVCSSDLLPAARQQAAERLRELIGESAPSTAIANARTELAYVRHAKGPIYQSHLLTYLGVRQVDAVSSEERRVGKECVSTCRSRGAAAH